MLYLREDVVTTLREKCKGNISKWIEERLDDAARFDFHRTDGRCPRCGMLCPKCKKLDDLLKEKELDILDAT